MFSPLLYQISRTMRTQFLYIFLLITISVHSQPAFAPLSTGVLSSKEVKCVYGDTVSGLLYAGGNFTVAGGLPANRIASWNGTNWDSLSSGAGPAGAVYDIDRYNGSIIAGGSFSQIGGVQASGLAAWDGTSWSPLVQLKTRYNSTCSVFSILVENGQLYIAGSFDSINGMPANSVARFDGSNWFSYPMIENDLSIIGEPTFYNGELYVIGNIWDPNQGVKHIVRYDGTSWLPVGNGFSLGAYTNALEVYNNELYIGGFFSPPNDPGYNLVKWNGTNYIQLNMTPTFQVHELKVIGNKLYVGGTFWAVGNIPNTAHCARLNGSTWESIGGVFDNGVLAIDDLNGDIFIGGGFWTVDGDTMNAITRYVGAVGMAEYNSATSLLIYYGDGNAYVMIPDGLTGPCTLTVFDVNGCLINEHNSNGDTRVPINFSDRPTGVYFVRYRNEEGFEGSGAFVKYE